VQNQNYSIIIKNNLPFYKKKYIIIDGSIYKNADLIKKKKLFFKRMEQNLYFPLKNTTKSTFIFLKNYFLNH